eukprot:2720101-Pyramimonas_sp.AAC.1
MPWASDKFPVSAVPRHSSATLCTLLQSGGARPTPIGLSFGISGGLRNVSARNCDNRGYSCRWAGSCGDSCAACTMLVSWVPFAMPPAQAK